MGVLLALLSVVSARDKCPFTNGDEAACADGFTALPEEDKNCACQCTRTCDEGYQLGGDDSCTCEVIPAACDGDVCVAAQPADATATAADYSFMLDTDTNMCKCMAADDMDQCDTAMYGDQFADAEACQPDDGGDGESGAVAQTAALAVAAATMLLF